MADLTNTLIPALSGVQVSGDGEGLEVCCVAVVYEDTASRDRAIHLSHRLVKDFWHEIDFSFSWCRFRYLADSTLAALAAEEAARSHIVVVSASTAGELPDAVIDWLDRWSSRRSLGLGIIVPLLESVPAVGEEATSALVCLQDAARRAGMDCLTPGLMRDPFSPLGSVEYIHDRATQTTRVLSEILKNLGGPPPPSHWGINE